MSNLAKVLVLKIVLTIAVWCVPLLLFPTGLLRWLGFEVPEPQLFLRLLGMAYSALVIGYGFGLRASLQGIYPAAAVWVGIVSNGGAFLLLAIAAIQGVWASWGFAAQVVMWGSLIGTALITGGLIRFGPCDAKARA